MFASRKPASRFLRKIRNEIQHGDLHCAAQSYGEVQASFLRHPCKRLQQRLFPLADVASIANLLPAP